MSFHLWRQGFVFEDQGDGKETTLVCPITPEASIWLHLIVEALWPERVFYFVNGAYAVRKGDWTELFLEIYKAGWRFSAFWRDWKTGNLRFNLDCDARRFQL